jgi:ribosomal protein L13E
VKELAGDRVRDYHQKVQQRRKLISMKLKEKRLGAEEQTPKEAVEQAVSAVKQAERAESRIGKGGHQLDAVQMLVQ